GEPRRGVASLLPTCRVDHTGKAEGLDLCLYGGQPPRTQCHRLGPGGNQVPGRGRRERQRKQVKQEARPHHHQSEICLLLRKIRFSHALSRSRQSGTHGWPARAASQGEPCPTRDAAFLILSPSPPDETDQHASLGARLPRRKERPKCTRAQEIK
ncbi:hypothetical protein LX36DRAFT_730852, partial [Colletotrichum falcatum]